MENTKINTYLGKKGYTLFKNELSIEKQKQLRNELTIKPFVMGAPINSNESTFFAYRESSNKFFVPHYYGVENFGPPKECNISEGLNIDLEFAGTLRDYQEPVMNKFINHCINQQCGGGLLDLYCAWGKTTGASYAISKLKKKTLVIVHKEFLMNQWIERIQQFLPGARIGKIQGPIIDVEDKDIVICMLQSLISKDYDQSIFDQFGFTIVDEVHHISSQTFSNALFKVITKYMLGLSATMERKDGTTHVFKMFLGDVIFKSEKKNEHIVEVRALSYKVNDEEFNETILDYRGKPQNSSMISKLCEYNRRTEFIIQTLCDFIQVDNVDINVIKQHKIDMDNNVPNCQLCNKNNNYLVHNTCCNSIQYCMPCLHNIELTAENNIISPNEKKKQSKERPKCPNCKKVLKYEQNYIENKYVKPLEQTHTIIMAHNLNILHYMYKKMVCKNLASVGYYIGGMKESELKNSEKKQVILASFSMCSEGLDIPTLNTEFLITPKTDIIQIVGRILRSKHAFSHPIIYDFVDSHDLFQRQWLKRKSYYKKQNYKIIGTNSIEYNKDISKWKNIYEPKIGKLTMAELSSINSDSSTDDFEEEQYEPKDEYLPSKCLLSVKNKVLNKTT